MLPPNLPEEEIVARAVQGEKEAFGWLYDRYVEAIYTFIYYQVSSTHEAEDLAETVFLKAFEKLPEFRRGKAMTNFRAWLYRIARNLVIDTYRTRKATLSLDPDIPLASDEPPPGDALDVAQSFGQAQAAIARLEPHFREVIVMRFMQDMSYAEVAAALEITENYVRVLQHRALKKIREYMELEFVE